MQTERKQRQLVNWRGRQLSAPHRLLGQPRGWQTLFYTSVSKWAVNNQWTICNSMSEVAPGSFPEQCAKPSQKQCCSVVQISALSNNYLTPVLFILRLLYCLVVEAAECCNVHGLLLQLTSLFTLSFCFLCPNAKGWSLSTGEVSSMFWTPAQAPL